MIERRKRRSQNSQEAISFLLDAVKEREQVDSLALTTSDGLLLGGCGTGDLEEMGALGAASEKASFSTNMGRLHVSKMSLKNAMVCLTSLGKSAGTTQVLSSLNRILD